MVYNPIFQIETPRIAEIPSGIQRGGLLDNETPVWCDVEIEGSSTFGD